MNNTPPEIPTSDGQPPCAPHIAALGPAECQLEPGRYSWCSCGYSKNQPFCDGSHKDPANHTNRKSVKFEISEAQTVALCQCKHTHTPPFCDGTHEKLSTRQLASELRSLASPRNKEQQMTVWDTIYKGFGLFVGRLLIASIFLVAAYRHATDLAGMQGYMSGEMPFPPAVITFLSYGAVAFLALGGLSLVFGAFTRVGACLLVVFLALATYFFHHFWSVPPEQVQMQTMNFSKNVAILGGLLSVMAYGAGSWSIDALRLKTR